MLKRILISWVVFFFIFTGLNVPGICTEKITLKFGVYPETNSEIVYEKLTASFESEHPNIEIKIQPVNEASKLLSQMAAGKAPDVINYWQEYLREFFERGQTLNLNPYLDKYMTKEELEDFYPRLLRGFRAQGIQYALPHYTAIMALYYNKNAFDEAGLTYPDKSWNWETFRKAANKLTIQKGGRTIQYGYHPSGELDRLTNWIWQNEGHVMDPNRPNHCIADEPATIEALEFLHTLVWEDKAVLPPYLSGTGAIGINENFIAGKVAMVYEGNWMLPLYSEQVKFDWDVAHLPKGKTRATMFGLDGFFIWSKTEHPTESFMWLKKIVSPEANALRQKIMYYQSARKSVAKGFLETFPSKNLTVFLEAMEDYARPSILPPRYSEFLQIWRPAIEKSLVLNKVPVKKAITNAVAQINKMYQRSE